MPMQFPSKKARGRDHRDKLKCMRKENHQGIKFSFWTTMF
uniref:Uncharacterized protein n=1 Tax=Rhizophora mucronata TaxID=61149 RepID=A0A2P2Q7T1_RHIMU